MASLASELAEGAEPASARRGAEAVPHWIATNDTNDRVEITAADGSTLAFGPFQSRVLDLPTIERFNVRSWGDRILVEDQRSPERESYGLVLAVGLGFWFAVPWTILSAFVGAPNWWVFGWIAFAAAVGVGAAYDGLSAKDSAGKRSAVRIWVGLIDWLRGWAAQQVYLLVTLVIGIVVPAAIIFFASNGLDLVDRLRDDGGTRRHELLLQAIARIMQLTFVAVASLVPALLFFLFDREHLATLRDRFVRQIIRFDRTLQTRGDVLRKYQKLMDEAYGRNDDGKILPGRRSPLLLATLVLSLGWTYVLVHGDATPTTDAGITGLFEPRLSAPSFAYLGAYFYGINAILRGYVRRDLRPKTYSTLTVRILVVVVLAWVLEQLWHGEALYVVAFLSGIVPETALVLIREGARKLVGYVGQLDDEPDPLTRLEGIDLYDRARLYDEGVTNVESLAHHDVIELMLQTRIPVPRLLDWVDQAILYIHAGPRPEREEKCGSRDVALKALRDHGIRTATDLDNAFWFAGERGQTAELLQIVDGVPCDGIARLQVMKDAIGDEEWMENLRYWRRLENAKPEPIRLNVADLPA